MSASPPAVTLARTPPACEVCGGKERVLIASPRASHSAVVPCLHCRWGLPIRRLLLRGAR